MTSPPSANRWAADLNRLLDQVYADGADRFPVKVADIALEISAQRYPKDAITIVQGASLGTQLTPDAWGVQRAG